MSAPAASPPALRDARRCWLALGLLAHGDPATQVARLRRSLVIQRGWLSDEQFQRALDFCTALPGPLAPRLVIYAGWLLHGLRGGIVAGLLFLAPSLLAMLALAIAYPALADEPAALALLGALRPALVAVLLIGAARLGRRCLRHPALWAVAAVAWLAMAVLRLPFPLVVALAALAGSVIGRRWPGAVAPMPSHPPATGRANTLPDPDVVDDTLPVHQRFRLRTCALRLAAGAVIAAAGIALIGAIASASGPTGSQLAAFHLRAALSAFGADLALVPYLHAAALQQYHWLDARMLTDALALAMLTPGPLTSVAVFVGFTAGWSSPFAGEDASLLSASLGSAIAIGFAMLPAFVLTLAGAPFIEGTRHRLALRGPLTGIGAAVTGSIAAVALMLAGEVFITPLQQFDGIAIGIAAAVLLLSRWRLDAPILLALAGGAGLLREYLGV